MKTNTREKDTSLNEYKERNLSQMNKLDNFIKTKLTNSEGESQFKKNLQVIEILAEENLIEKFLNFLQNLIIKTNEPKETSDIKSNKNVNNILAIKNTIVEDNCLLRKQLHELVKEYEDYKTNSELTIVSLSEQLKSKQQDHITSDKIQNLNSEIENLKRINSELNKSLDKAKQELLNKQDYITQLEEEIQNLNKKIIQNYTKEEEQIDISPSFDKVIDFNLLESITIYLNPIDIFNLKFSTYKLSTYIETSSKINKQLIHSIAYQKNTQIAEFKNNIIKDSELFYESGNNKIESLLSKYNPSNEERNPNSDINRRCLGNTILRSIDYINVDVENFINALNKNKDIKKNKQNSVLGSFGGYMNNIVNNIFTNEFDVKTKHPQQKSQNSYNIYSTNPTTKEPSVTNSIENQFLNYEKKEMNFNFSSPVELKNLIYTCFFTLGESNNYNTLKTYIEDLSDMYSKLLFFSFDVMKELSEIRLVKNYLYDYIHEMKEEKRILMKELNDISKRNNSLEYVNKLVTHDRDVHRRNSEDYFTEIKLLNLNCENLKRENEKIKDKFTKLNLEHFDYLTLIKKQNFYLKSDLQLITKERDDILFHLKNLKSLIIK